MVYLLYGTESLLMDEFVENLRDKWNTDEMNTLIYHLDETPLTNVLQEASTIPFFSDVKLIIAKNATLFTAAKPQSISDQETESLIHYIENPSPSTVLVFIVTAEKLDERKKITKTAKKLVTVVPCQPLKEVESVMWVGKKVQQQKSSINKGAATRLVQLVGTDLIRLRSEIDKLILYAEGQPIDEGMVELLATTSWESSVFAFVDQVVRGQIVKALASLTDLVKMKEAPIYLLFMITRQVRLMLQIKVQVGKGYTVQQVASQIGAHPYACKVASEQARDYTITQLERLLIRIADLDAAIKQGHVGDLYGLQNLIVTWMGSQDKATV